MTILKQRKSKQWMHTDSTSKPEKFKQPLSKRKTYSFLGPKRSVVGGLYAAGENNEVYCETLSSPQSQPKQTKRNALVRRYFDP